MDVELTVTPLIVLGDGDRIIYKNAAAKKLLPFCRKGTTINRYLSYTGESRYLELVRQSEGCAIIELSESLGRCYRALTVRRDGVVVMTFLPILQGGAKDVLAEYAETLSFAASDGIMDFVLRSSDFVDRPAVPRPPPHGIIREEIRRSTSSPVKYARGPPVCRCRSRARSSALPSHFPRDSHC